MGRGRSSSGSSYSGSSSSSSDESELYERKRLHPEYIGAIAYCGLTAIQVPIWVYVLVTALEVEKWCHDLSKGACSYNSMFLYGNFLWVLIFYPWMCRQFWIYKVMSFDRNPVGFVLPWIGFSFLMIGNILIVTWSLQGDTAVELNPGYMKARIICDFIPCLLNLPFLVVEIFSTSRLDEEDLYSDMDYGSSCGSSGSFSSYSSSSSRGRSERRAEERAAEVVVMRRYGASSGKKYKEACTGKKGTREAYGVPPDAHPYWAQQFIIYKDKGGDGGWEVYLPVAQAQYEAILHANESWVETRKKGHRPHMCKQMEKNATGQNIEIDMPVDADNTLKMRYCDYRIHGGTMKWSKWLQNGVNGGIGKDVGSHVQNLQARIDKLEAELREGDAADARQGKMKRTKKTVTKTTVTTETLIEGEGGVSFKHKGQVTTTKVEVEQDVIEGDHGGREAYNVPANAHAYWAHQFIIYKDMGGMGEWSSYVPVAQKQYEALKREYDKKQALIAAKQQATMAKESKTTKKGIDIDIYVPHDADHELKMKYINYRIAGGKKKWNDWLDYGAHAGNCTEH